LQWIQQSNTPCKQTVQVCGFSAGLQDNWLITQLINRTVNGTRLPQVSVTIEFELRNCLTALNCQQTFSTHVYETSTSNSGAARDINNYQQVERVSPVTTSDRSVSNEVITINFNTNHSSFYFAIQDEATCIVITRLIVFYTLCLAQTDSLIQYPETIARGSQSSFQEEEGVPQISASCVENAQPENGIAPVISGCLVGGIWGSVVPGAGCQCLPGHFRENESCTRKCIVTASCCLCTDFTVSYACIYLAF
jgi:hypothetical protein